MANDVQVFDGFRYEFEEASLWNSDKGTETPVTILKLIDDARGAEVHAYFAKDAFAEFAKTLGGGLVASPDFLRRIGV